MALNKLKKWIGTQAMTAFFDQLNDNVDATNAAIDDYESFLQQYSADRENGQIEYLYISQGTQTRLNIASGENYYFVLSANGDNNTSIINVTRFSTTGLVYSVLNEDTQIAIATNADRTAIFLTPTYSVRGFVIKANIKG